MSTHFLLFNLHEKKGRCYVKPSEITSVSPAPKGGARIVTRQNQTYYVNETVEEVQEDINDFFENKGNK